MSKIIKGVKKVFKKVVKSIKKIAPIILAVGAIVFTAGAALGLAPMLGGWTAAVSSVTAGLGSGVLGGAVTGAITQAGYSAVVGGIISEVSGGSFSKGAKAGAVAGLITGGVSGGMSAARTAALSTPGSTPPILPGSGTPPVGGRESFSKMFPSVTKTPSGGELLKKVGGLFQKGGWLERNQDIVGGVISGVGQGLLAGSAADADRDFLRERSRLTRENYAGTDPGRNYRDLATANPRLTSDVQPAARPGLTQPTERYDPRSFGSFEYQYDPEQGRIVKVPAG